MIELEIEGFGTVQFDVPPGGDEAKTIEDAVNAFHANPASLPYFDTVPRTFNTQTQRIEPVQATLRDRIFNKAIDFLVGEDDDPIKRQQAIRRARSLTEALDFLPGIGDSMLVSDANQAFRDENYLDATILTGIAALGMVPVIGDAGARALRNPEVKKAATDVVEKLNLWHGSPHRFDRFDLSKLGTGEGAQAYGHGLYFSEHPDVAKAYVPRNHDAEDIMLRKSELAMNNEKYIEAEMWERAMMHETPSEIREYAADTGNQEYINAAESVATQLENIAYDVPVSTSIVTRMEESGVPPEVADAIQWYANRGYTGKAAIKELEKNYPQFVDDFKKAVDSTGGGALYNVELDVNPESLLDWDKPLGEQTDSVRGILFDLMDERNPNLAQYHRQAQALDANDEIGRRDLRKRLGINIFDAEAGAGAIYQSLGESAEASARLREKGIPGIRYYDGFSRSSGEGTRNYVIFDDNIVKIKNVE